PALPRAAREQGGEAGRGRRNAGAEERRSNLKIHAPVGLSGRSALRDIGPADVDGADDLIAGAGHAAIAGEIPSFAHPVLVVGPPGAADVDGRAANIDYVR